MNPAHATDEQDPRLLQGRLERLAMAAGALIMIAIVGVSILIAQRTSADAADLKRSLLVRSEIHGLMNAVTNAETGQRGYLLTGRPTYLVPYTEAVRQVPDLLANLDRALGAIPDMQRWRAVVQAKMAELAETVRLEQAGRHDDAIALVKTDRGRLDMVEAREISGRLVSRQAVTVAEDLAHSEAGARLLVIVDAVALVQLLLLAGFVASSLRGSITALNTSRREVLAANIELQAGRDRLELAVAERTSELLDANAEVQRFAYIVSHDLRAPLLNIIGFTAELQDATNRLNRFVSDHLEPAGITVPREVREASQDDLPEAIRFIQTSTAKMDRLITAILRLSREGRRVLTPERLDMTALLGSVADSVRQLAEDAGAEISLGALPPLVSDRIAIEQVFSNIVENALKYAAPGRPGRIRITGGKEGAWMRYDVADNGRGVAERDLERIFELFRRAGSQDRPGEGIGLAHVRALLRRLGGTIVCESTPGVGSIFIVRLPPHLAYSAEGTE